MAESLRTADVIHADTEALKVPPNSLQAEQAVLGGLMLDNRAWERLADMIVAEDFYRRDHQLIFNAIGELAERGQPSDAVTVSEFLERRSELDDAGGLGYLGQLAKDTPSAANIVAYAEIVREKSILRQLIDVGAEVVKIEEVTSSRPDLAEAKALAEEEGNDNIWAIAEIMTVYGFMMLTDYFDAIPYTEALQLGEDISYPVYDAQSDIYPDLITRLTAAAARIDPDAVIDFSDFDPVYHGDVLGWRMFANSLRLRLAMRMVNVNPSGARAAFEAAWALSIFTSVADQADVDWEPAYPAANPCYEAIVFGGRPGDFRMSQSLIDRLVAFNDPLLPVLSEPTPADGL